MSTLFCGRFQPLFGPAQGRKLFLVSGNGIIDLFYLSHAQGAKRAVEAVHDLARDQGFEITVSFDHGGTPSLGQGCDSAWREVTGATTADRPGEAAKKEFRPKTKPAPATPGQEQAAQQQVAAETVPPLRNLVGKTERAMGSGKQLLVVFDQPEELCHQPLPAEAVATLKQLVTLCLIPEAHPESRVVLLVKPGRFEEFVAVLRHLSVPEPIQQRLSLAGPEPEELRRFLDYRMNRDATALRGTAGERDRVVSEWHQRGDLLRNLGQAVNGLLKRPERPQRIEAVLDRQTGGESPEAVLKELNELVGLKELKELLPKLFRLLEQQNRDRREGRLVRPAATHMVFLGNPGTGKTVVARLVGRYLRAIGLRRSGAFVEISRSDLASQFNSGECIQRMRDFIQQAMGGVLFVDEAYQLAEGEWMQGALETLMKEMEDRRDSLTVIFAGYEEEMEALWRVNPGFRSRIPKENILRFPDYSAEELEEIFRGECRRRGLELTADGEAAARKYIACEVQRGRIGNGRGARELVEQIERNRAEQGGGPITIAMVPVAAGYDDARVQRLLAGLSQELVGTETLHEFLRETAVKARHAHEQGELFKEPLHCRFVGPPGTGKTTAARKLGELFKAMGLLSRGHVHEVDPIAGFGSQYVSEYAQRVKEQFQQARGGVLFVDEAYQLAEQHEGRLILHQLVQTLTSQGFADTVVVLAGYRDKMNDLMAVNSGLGRRIPHEIVFPPFGLDNLLKLFWQVLDARGYVVHGADREQVAAALRRRFEALIVAPDFGNAASVGSLVNEVVGRQNQRVQAAGSVDARRILPEDIGAESAGAGDVAELLSRFEQDFVGLVDMKQRIRAVVDDVRVAVALGCSKPRAPRLLFLGNPGTGKTTVARELGRILKALGCTVSDRCVETRGTELKGSFVGHSKDRVLKAFQDARGGVLIVDEAYSLAPGSWQSDSFALEAIDTLVGQLMLPANEQTVVILAGYPEPMARFLESNPGLASRFPDEVGFPDYTAEECLDILTLQLARVEKGNALPLTADGVESRLLEAIEEFRLRPAFGNAREMENLLARIRQARNHRLASLPLEQIRAQAGLVPGDVFGGIESWRKRPSTT
jgi:SpoVK/Ycf46/Vps4 family AAA+-type ATPase